MQIFHLQPSFYCAEIPLSEILIIIIIIFYKYKLMTFILVSTLQLFIAFRCVMKKTWKIQYSPMAIN